jgi:hypothetical protein
VGDDAWIEVEPRGSLTRATVYLRGGAVSRVWDVRSRGEVEDIAAQYAIDRSRISYVAGVFGDPVETA